MRERLLNKSINKPLYTTGAGCFLAIIIIFICGCQKAFNPTVTTTNANILVVEGFINAATDSTIFKLSRTVLVNSKSILSPETGGAVSVETLQGTVLTLHEISAGIYAAPPANLDKALQYRVRIKTRAGQTYLSDLVDVKVTPPIDSLGYQLTGKGIEIYANTHDPGNNSRYYLYSYRETWQFHSWYRSYFIFDPRDTTMVVRTPDQQVYNCFGGDTSAHTILNSTAALSSDIATRVPIVAIDSTSEKISVKYSILLTQKVLSKEAYVFYQNLKKNSEDLGSIFDAQPSLLLSNIHNVVDAAEPVIGYVGAGTVQRKRIYILKTTLPISFNVVDELGCAIYGANNYTATRYGTGDIRLRPAKSTLLPYEAYMEDTIFPVINGSLYVISDNMAPPYLGLVGNPTGPMTIAPRICADCTLRGHTAQPAFWK